MTNFLKDWPAALPAYMRGPYVDSLAGAVGLELDNRSEQCLRARMAAIPYAGGPNPQRIGAARLADGRLIECEPVLLPLFSQQRGIKIYPTESTLSQRIRLAMWWQLHQQRGTHWGEIAHVRPYFSTAAAYPRITIVFQNNETTPAACWYSVAPDGTQSLGRVQPSNFNYDDRPSLRTRWWAFVDMSGTGFTPPETYDSGGQYDVSGWQYDQGGGVPFTAAMAADVAAMFADWKGAHSWLGGVIAVWPMGGGALFPSSISVPVQDVTGWWSLPLGANTWASLVDPITGKGTRPPNFQWIVDNPAP